MEKKLKGVIAIIVMSLIAGSLITIGFNNEEKQTLSDKLMAYCNDELLPAYQDGFMTSLITNLDTFARKCVGGDVYLYSMVTANNKKQGVLVMCSATNETLPFKYPDISKYKK